MVSIVAAIRRVSAPELTLTSLSRLKADGITDHFCCLVQVQDTATKWEELGI